MKQELAEQQGGAVAPSSNSGNLLNQVIEASRDPAVDAEKMQAMANLAIQLQDREMQQQFNRDYNAAIMEMPVITKDGRIVIKDKNTGAVIQSTVFAKYEDLDRVVRPIAHKHNLAYSFEIGGDAQRITVRPVLRHSNGFVERGEAMPLPLETSGSKNNVQGAGSSQTYGKRYALTAAFAIVAEGVDDDGNQGQAVSLPHEREQAVLTDASAAGQAGHYDEWFRKQSPRDRAYLVQSGKHAEYGGKALPPPARVETRVKVEEPPEPARGPDAGPSPGQRETGPDQDEAKAGTWARAYIAQVKQCRSLDALTQLQDSKQAFRSRIKQAYPDIWRDIAAAEGTAVEAPAPTGNE